MQQTETDQTPGRNAGLGRRLMAMVYDSMVVLALLMVAGFVALPFSGPRQAFRDLPYTLFLALVWFAYVGGCWRQAGATLGMRAWKLRVVTDSGQRPGWGRCLVRFIVGIIGMLALGAGFLWGLVDRRGGCWHDLASGTWLLRRTGGSD